MPPWLVPLGAAFLGGLLAFIGRGVYDRWTNGTTARRLALALWEELSAVEFAKPPTRFAGFSSQVFDTLFAELAGCFPEDLFRVVVRYHWKMKFIREWVRSRAAQLGGGASEGVAWSEAAGHVGEAQGQWVALRPRLEAYGNRGALRLFVTRREHFFPQRRSA